MLLHKALEQSLALLLAFFQIVCGYRYCADVGHGEGRRHRNSQPEPLDVTVKRPREKKSGFQCRVHENMLRGRNQYCPELHGDLPSGSPAAIATRPASSKKSYLRAPPRG